MVSGASSLENITIGRGWSRLIITTCSSTSRLGESVSIMMTSGRTCSTARSNSIGAVRPPATPLPAPSRPPRYFRAPVHQRAALPPAWRCSAPSRHVFSYTAGLRRRRRCGAGNEVPDGQGFAVRSPAALAVVDKHRPCRGDRRIGKGRGARGLRSVCFLRRAAVHRDRGRCRLAAGSRAERRAGRRYARGGSRDGMGRPFHPPAPPPPPPPLPPPPSPPPRPPP